MPTQTAEQIFFLNSTAAARAEARTLANINRRALTLFSDGYTVKPANFFGQIESGAFYVTTPKAEGDVNGDTQKTYKVTSREDKKTCTCECFRSRSTCKHFLAIANMVAEGEQADREWERAEEVRNFFDSRFDF